MADANWLQNIATYFCDAMDESNPIYLAKMIYATKCRLECKIWNHDYEPKIGRFMKVWTFLQIKNESGKQISTKLESLIHNLEPNIAAKASMRESTND